MSIDLPHERLELFRASIELVTFVAELSPGSCATEALEALASLRRAADAAAFSLAEGVFCEGRERSRHFQVARGSALAASSELRVLLAQGVLGVDGFEEGRMLCEQLYAKLSG